nr:transcription repressor NadR [Lachnospiraceae bacterium]
MTGEERREQILQMLRDAKLPLSGTELSRRLNVSRQVVVQDIALLRAVNKNILSTNKGYVLFQDVSESRKAKRSIKVSHRDEQIRDELYAIVDLGGHVLDVVVEHEIYGIITCDLIIHSRHDVDDFVAQCACKGAKGLGTLTEGIHYHTVEADSESVLDQIEQELGRKGYLHND